MNFIRRMDSCAGPLVCRFLLLFKSVAGYASERKKTPEAPNILIIKFFGLGSILMTVPAIAEVKRKYPSGKIAIFTLWENKEICELIPWIDEVFLLDMENLLKLPSNFICMISKIRRQQFDVIVDLEFLTCFSALTTLCIALFSSEKTSVGFNSPMHWRNRVYEVNVSFDHSRHISKIFGKVFSSFAGEALDLSFDGAAKNFLSTGGDNVIDEIPELRSVVDDGQKTICVNINAGILSFNRRWPKEHFSILIKELIKHPDLKVVLIGGKGDMEYVEDFVRGLLFPIRNVINLCGKLSIKKLIGFFVHSEVLITNDSGPLHIAYLVGVPTISFFGPETPYLYGPIGENHYVFYEDLHCSPCLNIYNSKFSRCNDNICLKRIDPKEVLDLIKEKKLLDPREGGHLVQV